MAAVKLLLSRKYGDILTCCLPCCRCFKYSGEGDINVLRQVLHPLFQNTMKKHILKTCFLKFNWLVLSDEQMSKGCPFSLLNDEQMSNWLGVEHQPVKDKHHDHIYTFNAYDTDVFRIPAYCLDRCFFWKPSHHFPPLLSTCFFTVRFFFV